MFYSKSTRGFYSREIHCDKIPSDAIEITTEQYSALLEGQSYGKIISADENGYPILIDLAPPSESDLAKKQIAEIEASITDRRLREAMLSTTGKSWLADRDAEIAALRAKIV
jgi:hypothetical protein